MEEPVNVYTLLFHLAAKTDPTFLGGDALDTLVTMEANKLRWNEVPDPFGDRVSFATGYVMGREGMDRDTRLGLGENMDYDMGYEAGQRVLQGETRPRWDRYGFTAN